MRSSSDRIFHPTGLPLTIRLVIFVLVFLQFLLMIRPASAAEGASSPPPAAEDALDREIAAHRSELSADPGKRATTFSRLGFLLLKKGELAEALHSFDEALKLNPRSPEAKTGKGAVLARKGEFVEAERILREALLLNPDPARAHYERGLLHEQQGQYAQAVVEFREGLKKARQGRQ